MRGVLAAVMTGPRRTEIRELPLPEIAGDDGLLRVESCGVSEADPVFYRRGDIAPTILGHEISGTIERLGKDAAARWNLREGERVIVEEYIPCLRCDWCKKGEYRLCPESQPDASGFLRYGMMGTDVAPGLWGGFAEVLYLHPRSIVRRLPDSVSSDIAALALPLANAMQWAVLEGGAAAGKNVLIFGARLTGLMSVLAAHAAGATDIVLCGLAREAGCFGLAKSFGATHMLVADEDGVEDRIRAATVGKSADVVVDTTSDTSGRVAATAVAVAATGATLVLGGIGIVPLHLGEIRRKYLTLKPVRGHSATAVQRGLELLSQSGSALAALPMQRFSLSDTDAAIRAGGTESVPSMVRAEVRPWL